MGQVCAKPQDGDTLKSKGLGSSEKQLKVYRLATTVATLTRHICAWQPRINKAGGVTDRDPSDAAFKSQNAPQQVKMVHLYGAFESSR